MVAALPPSTPPHVRAALAEAKGALVALYGDRLALVVLYGSYARGDAGPESDVDVLVVLRGDYEPYAEIRRTGPARLELSLRHGVTLSFQPYSERELEARESPFLRSVASDARPL